MKMLSYLVSLVVISFMLDTPIFAAEETPLAPIIVPKRIQHTYMGVLVGIASPTYTGAQIQPTLGLVWGRRFNKIFGVALYLSHSSQTVSSTQNGELTSGLSLYGVEANYYSQGDLEGLSMGWKLGLASLGQSGTFIVVNAASHVGGADTGATGLSTGPRLGFDYRLMPQMSVGAAGDLLIQPGNNSVGTYLVIQMLGIIKYWL